MIRGNTKKVKTATFFGIALFTPHSERNVRRAQNQILIF